jgi:Domain of unknown function (DUF6471)
MEDRCPVDVDAFISTLEAGMARDFEWQGQARRALRAEIKRRRLSYARLAQRLTAMGYPQSETKLREQIDREVSSTLFAQCMFAMGVGKIRLDGPN